MGSASAGPFASLVSGSGTMAPKRENNPRVLTFRTSLVPMSPPLLWYVPHSRTQASRIALFCVPWARWHVRTASWVKFSTESVVNIISSVWPSLLVPIGIGADWSVETSSGRLDVICDENCVMNVRAASMLPLRRYLFMGW